MTTQQHISDLLAHRDGESLELEVAARIEADPGSRARLQRFRELKARLNELPAVTPSTAAWEAIQRRSARRRWINGIRRFPLATAASVFFAAVLGIIVWNPAELLDRGDVSDVVLEPTPAPVPVRDYAAVLDRSQQLESLLWRAAPKPAPDNVQRALVYRLADLDTELGRYPIVGQQDPVARERLWRQRVELLEALAQTRRARAVVQPAVY